MTLSSDWPSILPLQGAVQHYEWGGYDFIPQLLGIDNSRQEPFAELWIGAHPKSPSLVELSGRSEPLHAWIAHNPEFVLGKPVARQFQGRLPYLLKILDARQMLSIQAHPAKTQAEEGYARENQAGISLSAPQRNYKDDNHKPEAHVALTDFWMLHGFRPPDEIAELLKAVPEFQVLAEAFPVSWLQSPQGAAAAMRSLYACVMTLRQEEVDACLCPLLARLCLDPASAKSSPDYWALRAAVEFPLPGGHIDRGIFSIYFLNLLQLKPGQGTYQSAGVLHAYLEGTNVEIMANSDNVLRGGLTPKHVDVPELLSILKFEGGRPEILEGTVVSALEKVYRTPSREFELSSLRLGPGQNYQSPPQHSADTLICLEGSGVIQAAGEPYPFSPGRACMVTADVPYSLAPTMLSTLYKASIP
jgi:mannose-6-phosphate isomerase